MPTILSYPTTVKDINQSARSGESEHFVGVNQTLKTAKKYSLQHFETGKRWGQKMIIGVNIK